MIQIGVRALTVCGVGVQHGTVRHLNLHTCLLYSQTLLRQVSTASSQVDDTLHTLAYEL